MKVVTSDSSTLTLLERALDQTERLITAIGVDQAGLATPCSGWDVAAIVQHLAGQDLHNFLLAARGETADWQAPSGELGEDWAAAFRDRAAPLRAAQMNRRRTARRPARVEPAGMIAPRRAGAAA